MRKPHIKLQTFNGRTFYQVRREPFCWGSLSHKEKSDVLKANDFAHKLNRKLDEESLEKHFAKLEARKNAKV